MKKILFFLIGSFIFWSCSDAPKAASDAVQEVAEEVADHAHDMVESVESIKLDNGVKWQVNEEMKPFIEKGSDILDKFVRSSGTDYHALANQIKEQNSQLIQSCTMEGKSHDELHKWLHPHLDLVKKLAAEDSPEEAGKIVAELQKSYKTYHEYFN